MTRDDLRGIIEGITDEQLKKILDIHSSDIGKAKGNLETVQTELENAKTKIGEYETKIGELEESLGDAEKLKQQIDTLQADIDARKQADEAAAAEKALNSRFDAVCGESKFLNDFTKAGVFNEFKAALGDDANKSKSDDEVYKTIITGRDNLFEPEGGLPSATSSTGGGVYGTTDADVREIMGLPPLKN